MGLKQYFLNDKKKYQHKWKKYRNNTVFIKIDFKKLLEESSQLQKIKQKVMKWFSKIRKKKNSDKIEGGKTQERI